MSLLDFSAEMSHMRSPAIPEPPIPASTIPSTLSGSFGIEVKSFHERSASDGHDPDLLSNLTDREMRSSLTNGFVLLSAANCSFFNSAPQLVTAIIFPKTVSDHSPFLLVEKTRNFPYSPLSFFSPFLTS